MIILKNPQEVQHWSQTTRKKGQTIAFVPTMGALHEGHLSLLREGRRLADRLVLSLFVNPAQFGPGEDFSAYPRDEKADLAKAKSCSVDVVFSPAPEAIYPAGFQTFVGVEELSKPLCGRRRPGHFRGVATVVLKLFNIVQPDVALFGQKDFQQLKVIERMVKDLNLPVKIKSLPIVREADGLAMSSRNAYLTPEERRVALAIPLSLQKVQTLVAQGEQNPKTILNTVVATLTESKKNNLLAAKRREGEAPTALLLEGATQAPMIEVDYVSLCNPDTLEELTTLKLPALLAIACHVGKTRLIDNCLL